MIISIERVYKKAYELGYIDLNDFYSFLNTYQELLEKNLLERLDYYL